MSLQCPLRSQLQYYEVLFFVVSFTPAMTLMMGNCLLVYSSANWFRESTSGHLLQTIGTVDIRSSEDEVKSIIN